MSDELKSALDLALEKLDREMGERVPTLTDEQKTEIARIRARYQAKVAEEEIAANSKLKQAFLSGDRAAADEIQSNLAREKRRLNEKMEAEIEKIRRSAT